MPQQYQPFWFEQAIKNEHSELQILNNEIQASICIVGGGYTGLWSAIKLKEAEPELDITILEANLCGSGASGRNGGCMLTWSTKYPSLARLFGEAEAKRLVSASEAAVFEIENFCATHNIDCEIRVDGTYYTASNASQIGNMDNIVAQLKQQNINSWQTCPLDKVRRHTGSSTHLEGLFSPAAGSIQPAKLARGLKTVAEKLGIKVFEHSPMIELIEGAPALIKTAKGSVTADKVILATNAWMPRQFKEFSRSVTLVSSDMLITKPIPSLLKTIGLDNGCAVVDSRTFVHYYRTTEDGRLMMGKGGNMFAYGNKVSCAFDQASRYQPILKKALKRFFPNIHWNQVEKTWTGPSDRSVSGFPFFGYLRNHKNIIYGLGYSGNGVVQTYIGAEIIRSLTLNRDDPWSRSGLAQGPRGQFPPEPVRWLGAMTVRQAIRRKEFAEDNNRKPRWIDCQLAKFAASAGKSDK